VNKKIILAICAAALSVPALTYAAAINRQLEVGMSGADVSVLQSFLAGDSTIYPQGLVTGYFGFLTKAAVSNFQSENGLPAVGRVGPATLPVLNLQIAAGGYSGGGSDAGNLYAEAPTITNVGVDESRESATISWKTQDSARGTVHYSTSRLGLTEADVGEHTVGVSGGTVAGESGFRTAQSVDIDGLDPDTTYHYLVYATDANGNVSITWPSTFRTLK
jgi:peptidoglycan hydrolase-like protein with peptidoglycan-binding domain